MKTTTRLIAAAAALVLSAAANAFDLTIEVLGARSAQGMVYAGAYADEAGWLKPDKLAAGDRAAAADKAVVVLRNLPAGRYAVSAYHDENGNARLDTNVVGIPTERFGFSRDARGNMGPPKFADAVIELTADATITVTLH